MVILQGAQVGQGPCRCSWGSGPGFRAPLEEHSTLKIKAEATAGSLPSMGLLGAHEISAPHFAGSRVTVTSRRLGSVCRLARKIHTPQQGFRLAAL